MSSEEVVINDRAVLVIGAALVAVLLTVLVLIVGVVVLARQSAQLSSDAKLAAQSHAGLCAFRGQLKSQVKTSEKYLLEHPNGAPALSLSAASIQQSIDKQQATISSLSGLNCQP